MSAIFDPEMATWWEQGEVLPYPRVKLIANTVDRNVMVIREYFGGDIANESIELKLEQLQEIEDMLLNARLWLERATKQADELRAAEEVAEDAEEPQELRCTYCKHPFHGRQNCEACAEEPSNPRAVRAALRRLANFNIDGCPRAFVESLLTGEPE